MSKKLFWVVARLPQRLKSTIFEIFSHSAGPFRAGPFEKIPKSVDFSLSGKQCIVPIKMDYLRVLAHCRVPKKYRTSSHKILASTGSCLTPIFFFILIETLVDLASKSIQAGEPVWFGCDVSKYFARKVGLLTMDLYDYELVFGTKVNIGLNKAERLIYGDCAMNHAMLLTAVHIEVLHSGLRAK